MPKRSLFWSLAAMLLLLTAFIPKQDNQKNVGQQNLLTLYITVYDQFGNRIENAHVLLTHSPSSRRWTLNTNKNGRAFIPVDNNTQYSVVAGKTGFINSPASSFQTQSKTKIDTIPLTLILQ
jgi:hypothetical protein